MSTPQRNLCERVLDTIDLKCVCKSLSRNILIAVREQVYKWYVQHRTWIGLYRRLPKRRVYYTFADGVQYPNKEGYLGKIMLLS
jgi:hypothetical protein